MQHQSDLVEYQYRIELLTNELEQSSQALQQKSVETEEHRLRSLSLEHKLNEMMGHYDLLNQKYADLTENLKMKVIEFEELKSKYNRITQITLKDYEEKIERLVLEVEKQNEIIIIKAQESDTNRQNMIDKIQELQEERQKSYHMENFVKSIKSDKLEALHYLNETTKELELWKERLRESDQYRLRVQSLEMDIEQIRANYSTLFTQHLEEIQKLKAQVETQRQINENNLQISEDKYVRLLEQEKLSYQKELKEKVATAIVQMENQLGTLNNLLEAKQSEIERLRLQRHNLETEKTNSLLVDKNMKISEFTSRINQLERQLIEKTTSLDQLQGQIQSGQLIQATSQTILERQYKQLEQEMHKQNIEQSRLQSRCFELQDELSKKANLKSNYEAQINTLLIEIANIKRELMEKSKATKLSQIHADNEVKLKQKINQLESERNSWKEMGHKEQQESDAKIRYLLQLLEQKESQHVRTQSRPNAQDLLQAIIEESNSRVAQSNLFYHEEDSQYQERTY